jgi:hypothetical protein
VRGSSPASTSFDAGHTSTAERMTRAGPWSAATSASSHVTSVRRASRVATVSATQAMS